MAAPTYITFNGAAGTGSASLSASAPGSIVAGNLLLAFVYASGSNAGTRTITAPSGWTLVTSVTNGATTKLTACYSKTATGSEPASYTWSCNATATIGLTIQLLEFSPCVTDGSIVTATATSAAFTTTTFTCGDAADGLVFGVFPAGNQTASVTPTGSTARAALSDGSITGVEAFTGPNPGSTTVPAASGTLTASVAHTVIAVALKAPAVNPIPDRSLTVLQAVNRSSRY